MIAIERGKGRRRAVVHPPRLGKLLGCCDDQLSSHLEPDITPPQSGTGDSDPACVETRAFEDCAAVIRLPFAFDSRGLDEALC